MITITRQSARRLRSIFRQALGLTPSMLQQPLQFVAGPSGLQVFAQFFGVAACYREQTPLPDCSLAVPVSLLKEIEGSSSEPVQLIPELDGSVRVRWQDGAIPQERVVSVPSDRADFTLPALPEIWSEHTADFRQALIDAQKCVDASAARYALDCIQLRGQTGDVSATNGRQIFRQSGFQLGIEQDLLIRPCAALAAKEFANEPSMRLGVTEEHAVLGLGAWQFWLPLNKEARFPLLDDFIPAESLAVATLQLSRADLAFLTENLKRLPGHDEFDQPVTLDLNGHVAIRGRAGDEGAVTELPLCNSQRSGQEICLNTNRRFLEQAARFGFERLNIYAPELPIVCRDDRRSYVWAVLRSQDAIPVGKSVVIESPLVGQPEVRKSITHPVSRRTSSMATRQKVPPPEPTATPSPSQPPPSEPSVTEQALALRSALRGTLGQVNLLLRAIQRQKKQEKFLRSTLASLKQLQNVA